MGKPLKQINLGSRDLSIKMCYLKQLISMHELSISMMILIRDMLRAFLHNSNLND